MPEAPPIGYIVWWDLTKTKLERKKLVELIDRLDLPITAKKYTRKRDAFRRAVQFFRIYLQHQEFRGHVLDRVQKIHANRFRLCILKRVPGPRRTKIKQILSLFYSYGELECKHPKHEFFIKFREIYNKTKAYLPHVDMTMIFTALLVSSGSIIMHPKGRIYYVPYDARNVLNTIRAFLDNVEGTPHFWAVPQYDSEEMRSAIKASLGRYISQAYTHFEKYDNKNYTSKAIINKHFEYISRGRDILEYYSRKYGIDLSKDLEKYDERLAGFKKSMR